MAEYIERDVILDALINKGQSSKRYKLGDIWELNYGEIRATIDSIPNADVHPVVHCKDCSAWVIIDKDDDFIPPYCSWIGQPMHGDDYCSYGKSKDGET